MNYTIKVHNSNYTITINVILLYFCLFRFFYCYFKMKVISFSISLIAYLNTGLNRLFHEVNVNLNELMVFKFYRLCFFLNIMFLH